MPTAAKVCFFSQKIEKKGCDIIFELWGIVEEIVKRMFFYCTVPYICEQKRKLAHTLCQCSPD